MKREFIERLKYISFFALGAYIASENEAFDLIHSRIIDLIEDIKEEAEKKEEPNG